VAEKGAMIVTKNKVDDLIREDGKIVGIRTGEDEIRAEVVVAADGALSLLAEKAGLRGRQQPKDFAIGVKEVIELSPQIIEERFNLNEGEGAAQLFMGSLTKGMFGAAFLYTNIDSISLGIVVRIKDLMEKQPSIEAYKLMEEIKLRPEIGNLIKGGETVEYSAHVIPESGLKVMPRLYSDGILAVGDAAGFTLNAGITVRGMEFAIASGALAARAIKVAKEKNDFSAKSLSVYQDLLQQSFVLKDFHTFKHLPEFLDNPRLFTLYPQLVCDLLGRLMLVDEKPKEKLSTTVRKGINPKQRFWILKDSIGALRV
jgi:electron transfer flavoprotein-quinone oxidoreductase